MSSITICLNKYSAQKAFGEIKALMIESPVIMLVDFNKLLTM